MIVRRRRGYASVRPASIDRRRSNWRVASPSESIPIALTLNELLTNAVKHNSVTPSQGISCRLICGGDGVRVVVDNAGQLPAGFSLARVPGGVSGLGLVRALLPRRSASLTIEQQGERVLATMSLAAPGVNRLEPL